MGSFFGDFGDSIMSWASTANAIEAEGYFFRDIIFILDDYKASLSREKEIIRIFQNHADNRGRGRLSSSLKLQKTPYIRGLLLSTGEDFPKDVESVTGRTIVLEVKPDHNQKAGEACKKMRSQYKGFIPQYVSWVIRQDAWADNLEKMIQDKVDIFSPKAGGISNGLRIATNWALNATGFELFCKFALEVGAIDDKRYKKLLKDYINVVYTQIKKDVDAIRLQNPVEVFWNVMEQLLATEQVIILDLISRSNDTTDKSTTAVNKRVIGKVHGKNQVYLFPDLAMKHLYQHFRDTGQDMPFDKAKLRDVLLQGGHIVRANNTRITKQVRYNGGRIQAWQFNLDEFKANCIE